MHRNTRLTTILRLLHGHPAMTAARLGHHCEASERTIFRDIALLRRMNVPVEGEAGVGFHFDHTAELGPVRLATDEAQALFDCGRRALGHASPSEAGPLFQAMTKLKAQLPDVLLEALALGPMRLTQETTR